MSRGQRRGGYLATAEGVKKLKEAKRINKYTYEEIAQEAKETIDKVKRLFNPQWGNGKYKIGEEAVEAICTVLDLPPEDIVADWYAVEISTSNSGIQELTEQEESNLDSPYNKALQKIEQAARDGAEELDLSGMELTELPPAIGKLSQLKKLMLGKWDEKNHKYIGNSLSSLPPEIGQLTNLTELNLSDNSLSSLPPEIGQLTNLTDLNLSDNSLSSLPPEIGQLTNLTDLNLNRNSLSIFPPEILKITKLIGLYLQNNSLNSLPPEIGQLTNLTDLNINNNSLSIFPPEIIKLTNLTRLGLSDNTLSILPSEIGQLTNLTNLYIDNNSLSSLPPEIGKLTNLKILHIYNNTLSILPSEIGQLTNLTTLYLFKNFLRKLPSEIGQLTNLTSLYINNNSLSSLPPEIEKLTNLTELNIHNNFLSSLPSKIEKLSNLTELNLNNNSLSSLPPEIGKLTNLTRLGLSDNSLIRLPPEIKSLTKLTELYLFNNCLPISPEIINRYKEPATIINYYLSLQVNQKKPLHEAKMLLVGQGSVGKTSLVNRLIKDDFNTKEDKTEGINIQPWELEIDNREIQMNVWDFGGQEIMHATHQFFLTKRSLYLLVLDARLGEEDNRIEYWLKIIKSFGQDSPIIVVGNKIDQHPLDIDKTGLQKKYPNIKAFVETSCDNGQGIKELQAAIAQEINQLEHVDDKLPLTWFTVKKELEAIDQDFIPYSKYETLCKKEGVTEEDNQKTLVRFLHDLGIVLNFCDDPRLEDTHVLNPEWVTNGVYKILNDRQLILDHKGILARSMLQRILEKDRYPTSKHLFIIDMMRKFELCFDVEPDKKFLIPDILPKEEPFTGEWENTLAFEYHYPVLPSSIISRFIVRMNHYIHQKTYWRSGVVLANESNKALVKADREDKKIFIRVAGTENTRRNLLTAIRSEFDYIHKTIPGIIPEEKVPLLDYPEIPPIDYKWLLELERKNINKIIPPGLTNEIDIKKLLNGIASEAIRYIEKKETKFDHYQNRPKPLPQKEINKKIFISYSWREESKNIADQLDAAFQAKGIMIMRDLREVGYKGRIEAFMENLGRGKCVIVIISKAYLESENCMFELLQIAKHGEFHKRIFPIVLSDAKIYKPKDRIKYVRYWEQEIEELDQEMKTVSAANLHGFRDDIDLYTEIRNNLPKLTNILKDINALTAKIHSNSDFEELIEAVESKLIE